MAEKKDLYETLGINKSASKDEIKSAYRKLAKKYHPDNHETGNAEKFKEVQEAYDILYDDQKRQAYDQFGHAAFEQAGGNPGANPFEGGFGGFGFGDGGVDLGDIFSSFFGGGSSRASRNGPVRGRDLRVRLEITFEEAAFGTVKEISINREEECTTCHGSGAKPGTSPENCKVCGGTGSVRVMQTTILGRMQTVRTCDECGGTGKVIKEPCPDCKGRGSVKKQRRIKVSIPAGIDNGLRGGPKGNLYITISVKKHSIFTRKGDSIFCDVHISFPEAALGAIIDVPTLNGVEKFDLAEGTQTGSIFTLKGKGIKNVNGKGVGDLYFTTIVDVPKKLNSEQKELLKKFAEASGNIFETGKKRKFF